MKYLKLYEEFRSNKVDPRIDRLVHYIKRRCEENEVLFTMSNTKKVHLGDGVMSNGYFDQDNLELAVAIDKPIEDWLMILLHESSHMDQWIDNDKIWTDYLDCEFDMWAWIAGEKEYTDEEVKEGINVAKYMELDCERRTVQKIKDFGIEDIIDIDTYIQKANAYVIFYNYIRKFRKWYKQGPYDIDNIWKNMPKTLDIDYEELSDMFAKLYHECV